MLQPHVGMCCNNMWCYTDMSHCEWAVCDYVGCCGWWFQIHNETTIICINRMLILRSHHYLHAFVKLSLVEYLLHEWIYRQLGVDLFGQLGVQLGGNCDCRGHILYTPMWGGGFHGIGQSDIFSLIFGTSCSQRGIFLPPGFCYVCDCKKACVEQTGGSFTVRFSEHKNAFNTARLQNLQNNTSLNRHTHLTPSITQCKYYNCKTKYILFIIIYSVNY